MHFSSRSRTHELNNNSDLCASIMKRFILLHILLILSQLLLAQESRTIRGIIMNAETFEPIEYATIGILSKAQGTISNEVGEFSFIIEDASAKDQITFSAIGYKATSMLLSGILEDSSALEILLEPATYSLDEIVVTGVNPLDIIEKALEGIYKNYPTSPHLLKGFYREYMEEDGKYVRLVEAAVDIIEDGYRVKGKNVHSREKVLVKQIRNADEFRVFDAYFYDGLNYMLNENIAGYNPGGVLNTYPASDWQFEFEEKTLVEGEETYVISFIPRNEKYARPSGLVYLSTNDYSIIKMKWTINNALDSWLKKYYADTVYVEHTNWEADFSYRRYKDKMYLNYIKHTRGYEVIENDSNKTRHTVNVFSELLINDINNITARAFTDTKPVKDYNKAYFSEQSYDKDFWDTYNLPMATRKMRSCYNAIEQRRELRRILSYDPTVFLDYDEFGTQDTTLKLEKYELWFDLDEDIIEGEPDFTASEIENELEKDAELEEGTEQEDADAAVSPSIVDKNMETEPDSETQILPEESLETEDRDSLDLEIDSNKVESLDSMSIEIDSIITIVDSIPQLTDSLYLVIDSIPTAIDSLHLDKSADELLEESIQELMEEELEKELE